MQPVLRMSSTTSIMNSAAFLLFAVGILLGLTFPLGKIGAQAEVSPVVWAFLMSGGAAFGLLLYRIVGNQPLLVKAQNVLFYVCAAVVSLVIPNILTFSVIPELGSGFTGLLFTLSPLFTVAISSIWQVRMPTRLGLVGIAIGFVGAVIVSITRGEIGHPANITWVLAGLGIPVSLAVGNVFRTMAWPDNAEPMELAIGVNLAAATLLLLLVLVMPSAQLSGGLPSILPAAFFTILVASVMVALHARLQLVGGPTYLSQIGYIAAAVALLVGTLVFDESYALLTWAGALIIVVGAVLSVLAQQPANKRVSL